MSSLYGRVGQRWEVGPSLATRKVQEYEAVLPLQVASNNNVRYARAGIKLAQCSKYMNTTSARAGIKLTQCSKYMNTNIQNCKLNTIGTVCVSEGPPMTHCICSPTMAHGWWRPPMHNILLLAHESCGQVCRDPRMTLRNLRYQRKPNTIASNHHSQ